MSLFVSERGSRHEHIWEQSRMRLGADTNASGSRYERIWEQIRTHLGAGTDAHGTVFAKRHRI